MRRFSLTELASILGALALSSCGGEKKKEVGSVTAPESLPSEVAAEDPKSEVVEVKMPAAHYVGEQSCMECHEQEHADWTQSHHFHAMELPTAETVRGDFDDAEFTHFGHLTRFVTKDDGWYIDTEGPDGKRQEYKVAYTFGWEPLQQYLVEFPGGRLQAFNVCWDVRPAEEGGQRWYHLYPDEEIPPDDVLHWTGKHFNWNYMCADCHSTDLQKKHDPITDVYATSWSSMNVSCESCHGPASEHLAWAREEDETTRSEYDGHLGLTVKLKEEVEAAWFIDPESGQPRRSSPLASTIQVETCAPCHAHRRILQDGTGLPGQGSLLQTHVPSVLSEVLYHADGQIKEEVYVYGSFVQSKMFHSGVRCTDCHHPHTMRLQAQGNALCIRCHDGTRYDVKEHHFHEIGGAGASCVDCHMPGKHYMGIDFRRDHSLRIPRPDLSEKLGTPNACNICHEDQSVEWAAEAFVAWWGDKERPPHYGEMLTEGRSGSPAGRQRLVELATDVSRPALVRATAVSELGRLAPDQASVSMMVGLLGDADPLVRQTALEPLSVLDPAQRLQFAGALLQDPVRGVRIEAARLLAAVPTKLLSEEQSKAYATARAEYETAQKAVSDRAGGHMGLALLYSDEGKVPQAEAAYRDAFRIEPDHLPSRVNLSELLHQQGRTGESTPILEAAVAADPENGYARETLGRHWIRLKQYEKGLAELGAAARLMPNHASTQFFYAVALNSMGREDEALAPLQRAIALEPGNAEYLAGAATICRDAGRTILAISYAEQLVRLDPGNPGYQQLLRQLRRVGP